MHGGLQGVSAEDFAASWERFLEALWTAVNRRLEQTDYDSFRTEFRSLYVDTFDTLRSERLLSEMRLPQRVGRRSARTPVLTVGPQDR